MKKFLAIFLIGIFAVSLSGCFGNESSNAHKDGTYLAEAAPDKYGWVNFLEVNVKDGNIDAIKFDCKNKDGKLKSEDEEYNKKYKEIVGVTAKDAFNQIVEQYKQVTDTTKMKKVTGATTSTQDFIVMMDELTKKMSTGDTSKATVTLEEHE